MRRFIFLLVCVMAVNMAFAQKYTVRNRRLGESTNVVDSTIAVIPGEMRTGFEAERESERYTVSENLTRAGNFQCISAGLRAGGFVCGTAGTIAACSDKKYIRVAGYTIICLGVISELYSIVYQTKSGVAIKASANKIAVRF